MSRVYEIEIRGLVQGVGFRPYVYRIAKSLNLHGFTDNRTSGVKIVIQATEHEKEEFLRRLYAEKPEVAQINGIQITQRETDEHLPPFYIARSKSGPKGITRVSPDIAVCRECLTDLREQPHRLNYPFINCTHCGPRFSIVETIPYDRVATTMRDFDMCPLCHSEYH
ncbi:MAG: acylphosphatase, partial [Bacteroidales bacterium]